MATSNFSVGPRYDYNNNTQPPKVVGYDVNNMVTVTVRKADIYAAAGSFKLGNIISLSEGTAYQPPMPYMTKSARAEGADAVPIAQGEQALTIDVSITYEIK